ncbi:MAG: hypothetical protein J3Q66DRAFT_327562 [Benniella sp.]|nr:MAG: hypothetical protein J3Q66DRAFT_327562 [Benniella sp.]
MMALSSAQATCARILIRARSRTTLLRRHQSTFSFFSRNQDAVSPLPLSSVHPDSLGSAKDTKSSTPTAATTGFPYSQLNSLKVSPSLPNTAPLLSAIQNKDQERAWMIYSALCHAGQLSTLLPLHHSLLLKSIRPEKLYRFTTREIERLTERFEQVWSGMLQCQLQPDMNDYTARLELYTVTRQHQMVDQTWAEMREKMGATDSRSGGNTGQGPVIQPTLYTFNLILSSCVPRKNIGLALETIALMRRTGIKPDAMSWDYVLQIHTALRDWPAVESTFQSAFITNSVLTASGTPLQRNDTSSEWMSIPLGQRAKTLHGGTFTPKNSNNSKGNIHKEKLLPTLQTTHTLFSYYAYTRDLEDLRQMFDSHVRLFGLVPTTRSYNEMIKFAFLARRTGDGLELFKELVLIGQNLDMMQRKADEQPSRLESEEDMTADSSTLSSAHTAWEGESHTTLSKHHLKQFCGPDYDTFKILINNDFINARNRWGRAWKWIQLMQQEYGLEPSDRMFRRTLAAMKRRGGDAATIKALHDNWDQVRAKRNRTGRAAIDSDVEEDGDLAQVASNQ